MYLITLSLCLYPCLYVSIHVSICICPYVSMSLCLYVSMSLCLSLSLCFYVSIYLCLYVSMSPCLNVSMSLCLHAIMCCVSVSSSPGSFAVFYSYSYLSLHLFSELQIVGPDMLSLELDFSMLVIILIV